VDDENEEWGSGVLESVTYGLSQLGQEISGIKTSMAIINHL
jgi:hypothetical protein